MAFMTCFLKGEDPSADSDRPPETWWQTSCSTQSLAEISEALWAGLLGDQVLILPGWFLTVQGGIKTDGGENET